MKFGLDDPFYPTVFTTYADAEKEAMRRLGVVRAPDDGEDGA